MMWKAIGQSVIGTSHTQFNKTCEDAVHYTIVSSPAGEEVLVCCISDGAGSATHAAEASSYITNATVSILSTCVISNNHVTEAVLQQMFEALYDELLKKASIAGVELNEFSCTLLGCVVYADKAVFFQTGDGAIIRDDGSGSYVTVWWPQNGEYNNTTSFFIDDASFSHIKKVVVEECISEVGLFTDGLQLLALNNENLNVHQPFFAGMYKWLSMARTEDDVAVLNRRLNEYLGSDVINNRTDDDKTLFLATRLSNG